MTAPIVTETTRLPEPVAHDPFIDDVVTVPAPPPEPILRRRRIFD